MQLALKHRGSSEGRVRSAPIRSPKRYTQLTRLEGATRAEVLLAIAEDADALDQIVAIKIFLPERPGATPSELGAELELRSRLHHENIARTSSIGFEEGRHFVVTEYLDGITLSRLLRWSSLANERLAEPAVTRILLAILAALEHAERLAESAEARALVRQPIAADDVFITYDGSIKLLGFKASGPTRELRVVPDAADDRARAQPAIDALLSSQLTPALGQVLARMASPPSVPPGERLWQIRQVLESWQDQSPGGDGRAALAATMSRVWPEARARQLARLEAAFAEVLASRTPAPSGSLPRRDVAVVSGSGARRADQRPGPCVGVPKTSPAPAAAGAVTPSSGKGGEASSPEVRPSRLRAIGVLLGYVAFFGGSVVYALERWGDPASAAEDAVVTSQPEAVGEEGPRRSRTRLAPPLAPSGSSQSSVTSGAFATTQPTAADAGSDLESLDIAQLTSRVPRGRRPVRARKTAPPTPTPTAPTPGYLTLDTTPWSNVSLAGVSLGQTPLVGVELPVGEHLLELESAELGTTSRYLVKITSGEATVRRLGLK